MSRLTASSTVIEKAWDAYAAAEARLNRYAAYNRGGCPFGDGCPLCAELMAREGELMDEARMTVAWEYGWSFRNAEMVTGGVNLS